MTSKISKIPSMGFWRTWGLIVGIMIGSGIFMMPALLAPFGALGLVSIVITGIGTFFIALMLGRLAKAIPKIGGPYAYTREGLGDFAAFLTAWGYSISIWAALAAIAIVCVGYLEVFIPNLTDNVSLSFVIAAAIIWGLVLLNLKGMREASIFQLFTSVVKIIPLIIIGAFGILYFSPDFIPAINPTDKTTFSALTAASVLTMWAFLGIEGGTIPAEDVIEPEKTIPKALFWSVISVTAIYFFATLGVMVLVPAGVLAHSTSPFADAAISIMGPAGAKFIALAAIVTMVSTINGNIIAGAQTALAAARDKLFPVAFSRMSKNATPDVALYVVGIMSTLFLVMNTSKSMMGAFQFLVLLSTLSVLIPYAFSAVSEMVMIKRVGGKQQGKTMALALIAFAYTTWVIIGSGAETVMWGFVLLLVGMPIYAWLHVHNEEVGECDE